MLEYLFITLLVISFVILVALFIVDFATGEKKHSALLVMLLVLTISVIGVGIEEHQKVASYNKVAGIITNDEEGYCLSTFVDLYQKNDKVYAREKICGISIFHEVKLAEGYSYCLVSDGYEHIPYYNGMPTYKITE